MSRIGKKPIQIPEGVQVRIEDNEVFVKGPKGELSLKIQPGFKVEIKDQQISLSPTEITKKTKALWGLQRSLLYNMVEGVVKGYEKKLQLEGVGFRAEIKNNDLVLNVGFSHPVLVKKPEGIDFSVEKNIITVSGIDKQKVGEVAAKIRKIRPPEPYKGKGIRYVGEQVRKKLGKKAVASSE